MAIGRSSLSSSFQLASLSPTSAAAKQHACHTHIPVQEKMGNTLPPTEWGWRSRDGILGPVETDMPVAPDYAPICKNDLQTSYGVSREEAARVLCSVIANPVDVSFFWKFNNSNKEFNVDSYIVSNTTSTVTYVPSGSTDFGNLFCWAKNSIGTQQTPCIFKVFIAEAPSSVVNCNITNVTSSSVDLKCSAGSDGGLQQFFFTEVYDKLKYALQANVTAENRPVFHIRHLAADMTFLFVVYAANEKGRSRSLSLHSKTISEHKRGALGSKSLAIRDCILALSLMHTSLGKVLKP
ncbi:hypothetical protein GQR58_005547 [Nymphon striatum]|nr:hypothetical protein GQR58_005547 [Nymphon striatum]